jgi:hypothetical protein
MVGLFLSLLDRVATFESPFESAENFLLAVRLLGRNLNDPYDFLYNGDLYIERIRREVAMPRYLEIKQDI